MMIHRAQNEPTNYQQWIKNNLCPQFQSTQMDAPERTDPISTVFPQNCFVHTNLPLHSSNLSKPFQQLAPEWSEVLNCVLGSFKYCLYNENFNVYHSFYVFNILTIFGWFQLLQCSKSNSTTNFSTREASRIIFIMNK